MGAITCTKGVCHWRRESWNTGWEEEEAGAGWGGGVGRMKEPTVQRSIFFHIWVFFLMVEEKQKLFSLYYFALPRMILLFMNIHSSAKGQARKRMSEREIKKRGKVSNLWEHDAMYDLVFDHAVFFVLGKARKRKESSSQ